MSISIRNRSTGLIQQINLESDLITVIYLKKLISLKYNYSQQNLSSNLKIFARDNTIKQYQEHEFVKKGQRIDFLFLDIAKNSSQRHQQKKPSTQSARKGIVSSQQLQIIINDAKIYMIKSANEQNIQKAKDLSIWATTFSNQERLKYSFQTNKHVLLLFATNRSFQIKGLARMQTQPQKTIDKSIWAGVSNIRLGGNFKIKWLRKKPLSLVNVQKVMGNMFKQTILRSCDGQQIDPNTCKPLAFLFQTPTQPLYSITQTLQQVKKSTSEKKIQISNNINPLLPMFFMPPSMGLFPNPLSSQTTKPTITYQLPLQKIQKVKQQLQKKQSINNQKLENIFQKSSSSSEQKIKKHKKSHKKSIKEKKKKRKYLTSESEYSSNSSNAKESIYSSDSESYTYSKKDEKKKKQKKIQKNKKKSFKKHKKKDHKKKQK